MSRKLTISKSDKIALSISRSAIRTEKLVYIAKANKKIKYRFGNSYIAYIGTTEKGANRIAGSAAERAKELLTKHGIKKLDFFVITCKPLGTVETWKKLESGLILTFRSRFGEQPLGNTQGKNQEWKDEKKYFASSALENVIEFYSS